MQSDSQRYSGDTGRASIECNAADPPRHSLAGVTVELPGRTTRKVRGSVARCSVLVPTRVLLPHRACKLHWSVSEVTQILPVRHDGSEVSCQHRRPLRPGSDKRDVLSKMESLKVDWLPVVDKDGHVAGIIDQSRLTASLILDVSNQLNAQQSPK